MNLTRPHWSCFATCISFCISLLCAHHPEAPHATAGPSTRSPVTRGEAGPSRSQRPTTGGETGPSSSRRPTYSYFRDTLPSERHLQCQEDAPTSRITLRRLLSDRWQENLEQIHAIPVPLQLGLIAEGAILFNHRLLTRHQPSAELLLRLWKLRATLDLEADHHREEQIGQGKTRTRSESRGGLGEDGEAQEQASISYGDSIRSMSVRRAVIVLGISFFRDIEVAIFGVMAIFCDVFLGFNRGFRVLSIQFEMDLNSDFSFRIVAADMAGRRNNNNGELGGQNNQFLEGLTALLHEQSRIHGEQIQQILQAREQGSTPRRSTPSMQPVYKQFRELGPTEFKGTTDPIAAEGWIRSLETIFDFMQLTDADKVRCAIFMLRDDARVWWEGVRLTVDLIVLTWANFKEVFYGKYFIVDNRTRLAWEFLELRQGDMTVAEYVRRFERGRYFVPMITSQPVEELKHFTEGLRPAIRHDVRLSRVTTFREAVDQALMSERDRNDMIKEAQNKRLSYQGRDQQEPGKKRSVPSQNPGKQSFKQAQSRQQIQKTQAAEGTVARAENKVHCSKCEKIHAGQCLTGTDACYMCKKSGHFARECPLLKEPTKGRVFAMTQEQVDLDTAIITGEELHSNRMFNHRLLTRRQSSAELLLRLWKLRATLDLEADRHREEQIGQGKTRTRSESRGGLGEDGEAQEQASISYGDSIRSVSVCRAVIVLGIDFFRDIKVAIFGISGDVFLGFNRGFRVLSIQFEISINSCLNCMVSGFFSSEQTVIDGAGLLGDYSVQNLWV
ncbi:hypothetical protein ZIOFF_029753 [Zingiber officinale]|uniref:CCHC-type domain-containing protein n=1 Tax=Zingiber officinale TaxID=94328 RepID=A0A8J5LAU8_ZINOF|nr:hypothetical protein ZIOFF_029753 [Zingiber officinale]